MFDVIVRGGTVIDGTGADRRTADVAITDGVVVEVGHVDGPARSEIDADGCIVTPGWVDIHTHYDGQATWDPFLSPSSWHGVTTAVMGNCGVGFAPVRPGQERFLIELMEGVEDIPGTALAEGIDWRWEHFEEYLDALDASELAIDVGAQVPHAAVRAYVLGERCNTDHTPTADEIAAMAELVRRGVAAGALGFSTSRTFLHRDLHGVHMPGTFAGRDELVGIGHALAGQRGAVLQIVSDHLGEPGEWEWIEEVAVETGCPVTLVPTSEAAYRDHLVFRLSGEAQARGIHVRPQVAGRPTGILHGLQSSVHPFMNAPTYGAQVAGRPLTDQVRTLADPDVRRRILEESAAAPAEVRARLDWVLWHIFPLGDPPDYEPDRSASVAGLAEAQGLPAREVMYDLLLRDGGRELFYQPLGNYSSYSFAFFEDAIEHPTSMFGLSDGGAHCGVIADAGMPTFVLTHWGRDRTKGRTFPLEVLVRKLTRETARAYGMADRGELVPGQLGDLNVIDFDALRLHRPEARHDLPAGGRRLVQRADGYRCVVKRGEVIVADGEVTDARPGRLVRRAG